MAMIDEIENEILASRNGGPKNVDEKKQVKEKKTRRARNCADGKTKEEIEAYRQKMMEKEEAMYLGTEKKRRRRRVCKEERADEQEQPKKKRRKRKCVQQVDGLTQASVPDAIGPMVPLYILKVPGLPDGECLVLCRASCKQ